MLSIIGTGLKIIGIILLCILCIFIVFILSVLFVPVRYRIKGYYRDTYDLQVHITWFLHLSTFQIYLHKDKPLAIRFRLAGLSLWDNQREKKEKKKEKNKTKRKQKQKEVNTAQLPETIENVNPEQEIHENQNAEQAWQEPPKQETNGQIKTSISLFEKIKITIKKAFSWICNIKYSMIRFCDRIKTSKNKLTYYIDLLQSDSFQAALQKSKKQILRVIRNVGPTKGKVNIRFGCQDQPDLVGKVMGIWGMTYMLHKGHIDLITSFEEDMLEAEMDIRGRISVYLYVYVVYLFLFDQDVKNVRKCIVQEDS